MPTKHLHDEFKADYTSIIFAEDTKDVRKQRRDFQVKWRLGCRGVGESLEETGEPIDLAT